MLHYTEVDYSNHKPISGFKLNSLIRNHPELLNPESDLYYDAVYECYIQSTKDESGNIKYHFFYDGKWIEEPMTVIINHRIEKSKGIINLTKMME